MINFDISAKLRKHQVCEKNQVLNPSVCTCENGKYLGTIIGDSVIIYDDNNTFPAKIVPKKTVPQ